MKTLLALLVLSASLAFSQAVTTSTLDGNVTDPQGALIVGASLTVTNTDNGATFKATTDERGHWVLPSMPAGNYRVAVTMQGFKVTSVEAVKIDAGVPATVNARLELGQMTETVDVTAGAELVQTTNATVNTTLQGRQVFELPFTSRNTLELLVTQPGTQTTGTARNSFINGLPFSGINITLDGINSQDNYYKSGDGFFTLIPVRPDSIEEITMSTSAAGADSSAGGAATVKFITKGGTNTFHGGSFWQHRNTALDANYYFNNIQGLPRDRVILNQGGVKMGGPIKKNKLFFFTNYEIYRYPATSSATRTVLTPEAMNGNFRYQDSAGVLHTVPLLQVAGANGYTSTQDPIMQKTFGQINSLTGNGVIRPRVSQYNDYNRNDLYFQPSGMSKNWYDTTRLDYNLTDKHHLQFVWTYFKTDSTPDITNSVVPIYPGTGTVLGADNLVAGQRGNRYAGTVSLRSSLTPMLTNEFRAGMNRSITMFRDQISSSALFSQWRGYAPYSSASSSTMGYANSAAYLTGVASVAGSSRRTSPVKEIHDTMSWVKGSHLLSFGGDFQQINFWYQSVGSAVIPQVGFNGIQTGDPIDTGSTGIFTNCVSCNFPGASTSQLAEAKTLYALLTGRVTNINRSVVLDEKTHQYGNVPQTDRNRQREYGGFIQDSWKPTPSLTLTLGLRFERQGAFENINNTYSAVSLASAWGVSGIGNLYKPGSLAGQQPVYGALGQSYKTPSTWSPSAGFAWQMPGASGPLGWLIGRERAKSVLRAGYGLSTIREGTYTFQSIYGSNQGVSYSASVDPISYPQNFGAAGSVLFRDANLPTRATPSSPVYPMSPSPSNSLNAFDPNLKMGYVQSWNIGFQRELTHDTVMEVRYTGNHGVHLWRQVNLNEMNIFENGFLDEFNTAYNNLLIARGGNISATTSNNFGNQGLAGQKNIPIISTALGTTNDTTFANYIRQNRPGNVAYNIYRDQTRMGRLVTAGYPSNMFIVNPAVPTGGSYLMTNQGSSNYNALQVEFRRRMSAGLLMQGSYVWAHSIINGAQSDLGAFSQPTTFRNLRLDRDPASFDIRHAFKLNFIYELPFGKGRRYLASVNPVLGKIVEGWQISGVDRNQSGSPFQLTSGGRYGMTGVEAGVELHNMTMQDLQGMMQIRKATGADGKGIVYYLPQSIIDNTNAAMETNGKTWANLDPSKPYIGPQLAPGKFGYKLFMYGPWQHHLDLSLVKHTRLHERFDVELRASFLDALNLTNFQLNSIGSTSNGPGTAAFGQTTLAFRDFSGTNDPGARMVEFQLRVSF
jgi:hypothetical protein